MGYELDRITRQYGVSTPTVAPYSRDSSVGAEPVRPGAVRQNIGGFNISIPDFKASQAQLDQYNKDLAAWNETKDKYDAVNRPIYDKYAAEYKQRLQSTPMYSQAQFGGTPAYADMLGVPGPAPAPAPAQAPGAGSAGPTSPADTVSPAGPTAGAPNFSVPGFTNSGLYNYGGRPAYKMSGPAGITFMSPYAGTVSDMSALPVYNASANNFAHGGRVKTHYSTAGSVQLPAGYENSEPPGLPQPAAPTAPPGLNPAAFQNAALGSDLQSMLAAYGPAKDDVYAPELKTARERAQKESEAFADMLKAAMSRPENEQASKAEMYFRLAAAFGAPTKTGSVAENLGLVGRELAEYSKGRREADREKMALALKGQELRMGTAKEDLATLRALSSEEMKDKRAVATELIKSYIKSGEPQSTAGKQALDEGLKPGTPEYRNRVAEIGNLNVEGKLAQINASLAGVSLAQASSALSQKKFEEQKTQQAKLSPAELKLKTETEETLAQTDQALDNLKKAYALNPNTFDTSLVDTAQRKLLEAGGSKDPKVAATREMENLLEKAALSQLKSTFPGAISNDERKALQDVQGLGAKSKEERARIMKNGYTALKSVSERHRKRLNEINSGLYRDTSAPTGDID